jgi:hypothetical protein
VHVIRRSFPRQYGQWHPHVCATPGIPLRGGGGALALVPPLGGPGELPNLPGSNMWFNGMDPSDPSTWVRPYNPQPGMIAYLNIDGAQPNPAGGVQRGKQPRLFWRGGVAGSSANNG